MTENSRQDTGPFLDLGDREFVAAEINNPPENEVPTIALPENLTQVKLPKIKGRVERDPVTGKKTTVLTVIRS